MKVIKTDLFTERTPNAVTFIKFFVLALLIAPWFSANAWSQLKCKSDSLVDCRQLVEQTPDSLVFDFTWCDSSPDTIGLPISRLPKSVLSQVAVYLDSVPDFEPGFYDIWAHTSYSDDVNQLNESFYLEVGSNGPCDATNVGSYFVIDQGPPGCRRNYAGRFYLTPNDSIMFKHYFLIYTVEDSLVNGCEDDSLVNDECFGDNESVQLFRMTLERKSDPGIKLTKKANKKKVLRGETVEYTLMVSNTAQHTARNLKINDVLHESVSLDTVWVPSEEFTYRDSSSGNTLSLHFESLPPEDSLEIKYRVTIPHTFPDTKLINASEVTSSFSCGATASDTVTVVPSCELSLTKAANEKEIERGGTVEYTLMVSKVAQHTARNLKITDVLHESVSLDTVWVPSEEFTYRDSSSGNTLSLHFESLPPEDSLEIKYRVTVPETFPDTALINVSEITSSCGDATASVEVKIVEPCELSLTKAATPKTVQPGETIKYDIVLQNNGKETATNITVWDALPDSVDLDRSSVTPTPKEISADGHSIYWHFESLPPGGVEPLGYKVKVANSCPVRPDTLENTIVVTSDCCSDTARARVIITNDDCRKESCLTLNRNVFAPGEVHVLEMTFELASSSLVTIDLYDITGYHVTNILAGVPLNSGRHIYPWTGWTKDGFRVGSGVYIILFRTQTMECMRKVIVVR